MGQKISPISLRVGIQKDWSSTWFGGRKYIPYLKDDLVVRAFLEKKLKGLGVADIRLERGSDVLNVIITTSRPGLLIGRGGTGIEELKIEQIEKRITFRRLMKQTLVKIMSSRQVKGAKIYMGGRLDGAEIARAEHLEEGSLPLQTLRADIDYAKATAHTTFGTIGVKVWIYKGEKFEEKQVFVQERSDW